MIRRCIFSFVMIIVDSLSSLISVYLLRKRSYLTGMGLAVLFCGLGLGAAQAAEADQVRQGLPGRRISGASRLPTACAHSANPLVAIVPESNLGTTAVAAPALWLSVPEVTREKQLEFYLFGTQEEIIYQTSFVLEPTANLVGLDLGGLIALGGLPWRTTVSGMIGCPSCWRSFSVIHRIRSPWAIGVP